ncbi:MAG: hypothetical protein Q4P07_03820, partial [Ornithinimicrobium sp.]|nr:hypothetical protein [Ornithinimicrobium sp.]
MSVAAHATPSPQDQFPGLSGAQALVQVAETVAAAERPAVAAKAPAKVAHAANFGTTGFSGFVPVQVQQRTGVAASRTQERVAAAEPTQQAAPAQPAAAVQQAAPAQ